MPERWWVVLMLQRWSALTVNGQRLPADVRRDLPPGFLPAFRDEATARAWAPPGAEVVSIEVAPEVRSREVQA